MSELADPYNATINVNVKLCHQFWEEKGRGVVLQKPVCLVYTVLVCISFSNLTHGGLFLVWQAMGRLVTDSMQGSSLAQEAARVHALDEGLSRDPWRAIPETETAAQSKHNDEGGSGEFLVWVKLAGLLNV